MAITKQRLYSADGTANVREGVLAADAASWTPDDLGAAPLPDAAILDAREWETVRVFVGFTDGAGAVAAGTSITVQPLLAVRNALDGSTAGREWLALAALAALVPGASVEVEVSGHFAAFRVTAITLGGATDGRVRVTGGRRRTQEQD